jgi:1,4-alpha-glucan branching enzyme
MRGSEEKAGKRRVVFKVKAPFAKEIVLLGDFNNWKAGVHPMQKDSQGLWKVNLRLAPGSYEYKLLVDGKWWEDRGEKKGIRNPFGTHNRVMVVPERPLKK